MKYKIIQGDCLKVIPTLDNDFDICFTSPPYNLFTNDFTTNGKTKADIQKYSTFIEDKIEDWPKFMEEVILSTLNKCKYFFLNVQSLGNNKVDIITLLFNLKKYYCDAIIWDKGKGTPNGLNKRVMTATFEYIYIFSKKPTKAVGTKEWRATVKNLVKINGNNGNKFKDVHKALFPVELAMWVCENFVKEGGKVLDVFSGLSTTGIACKKLDLEYVGIEIVKEYCDIAIERWNNE